MERISWRVFGRLILSCLELPGAALSLVPSTTSNIVVKSLGVEGGDSGDPNEESSDYPESIAASMDHCYYVHTYI
jgi:hypothetical protein